MSLVSWLFGTPTTSDHTYTCECGEPMENTIATTTTDCTIRTWECTDDQCLQVGQEYRFDDDDEHEYGTGPLDGQVTP